MSGSSAKSSDPLELVGTLVDDRYRVEKLIGRGGMGFVYEAEHTRLKRRVAIKVLSQLQARRRFEREALTTARIDHPNSVRLIDFGHLEDETLFLVMELLEGAPLSKTIESGPLEPTRALAICRDVLAALEHAHERGVVHRDIKPENIFLSSGSDRMGEVAKVLDFGIAKMISDATASEPEEKLTDVGMAIGTPTYMSPEQGFGTDIDGRSDLYSLTIVLFELLTGAPPFRGESPIETLQHHISSPPPTLASVRPELADMPALEELIADGLAKNPLERIRSAREYLDRLDAVLTGTETPRSPTTPAAGTGFAATAPVPIAHASITASKPAQPILARAAKRHWPIGLGALLVVTVIVLLLVRPADEAASREIGWLPVQTQASSPPPPSKLAEQASLLLADQKPAAAADLVEEDPEAAADASAQLVLGHARMRQKQTKSALVAYARAIEISKTSGADAALLENIKKLLASRSRKTRTRALEVLIAAASVRANRSARGVLAEVASSHPKRRLRESAQEAAEPLSLEGLDHFSMYMLDLEQARTCKLRLEAVQKLRELGDPDAVPALRKSERRMSGGFIGIGSRNVNRCLRKQAREAADYLESKL